jgi:predicted 2-oxoglutarate/Fe(II)-dependent dioxygenase YbiX
MTTLDAASFNLHLVKGFFDARECDEMITELSRAPEDLATVYGLGASGSVEQRVRKTTKLMPSAETVELVERRLSMVREEIGTHFGINLTNCEDPQFLRYRPGDFFVAHQDGNTGLLLSEREQSRKISIVIFLNRQSEGSEVDSYGGGSLVFTEWRPDRIRGQYALEGEAGMLVAFPSETTHEVVPITWGERYSIASWFG